MRRPVDNPGDGRINALDATAQQNRADQYPTPDRHELKENQWNETQSDMSLPGHLRLEAKKRL
jgi:hypothetical protein